MNDLAQLVGQRSAREMLSGMLEAGRVPQALLFHGPEGVGKATAAAIFATALLCTHAKPFACGACEGCRLAGRGHHPDLLQVGLLPRAETPGGKGESAAGAGSGELRKFIIIDQIRQLAHLASIAPRMGRRRAFIIDPAERMMIAAQNALLKTLEEPPGQSVLILVAARPQALIPTVRSRCLAVGFASLPAGELASWLEARGIEHEEALARAALAEGRPGRAVDLDLEALRQRRDSILSMIESLVAPKPGLHRLAGMAADLAGKDEGTLIEGLDLLQALVRDAARAGSADAALVHADLRERLERLGRRLDPTRAASLVGSVDRLRDQLRFNLNRTLVAESLLAAFAGGPLP